MWLVTWIRRAWRQPSGWNLAFVTVQVIVVNDLISWLACQGAYRVLGVTFEPGVDRTIATWAPVVIPTVVVPLTTVPAQRLSHRLQRAVQQLEEEMLHRVALQAELEHQATHDALTGILNRRGFLELSATSVRPGAVLVIADVDRFKSVNDVNGHAAGDDALRAVSRLLAEAGDQSLVGRLGDDEFVALLPPGDLAIAEALRARLVAVPVDLPDGTTITVSASVGIGRVGPDDTLDSALAAVDAQMYARKRALADAGS